jgi:sensor domain CHASE-containing protein
MTLRTKVVLVLSALSALSIGVLFLVQSTILSTRFAKLERESTEANTDRAMSAVWADVSSVSTTVGDWAPWDDTYVFVQDNNTGYIANNLTDETVANIGMNLVLFVDNAGDLVYGKALDLERGTEVPLPPSVSEILSPGTPLLQMSDEKSEVSGMLSLPEGPLLVAAQPILTSLNEGPIQGTLIMGRYLDVAEVQGLAQLTHLSVSAYSLRSGDVPDDIQMAQSALSADEPTFVRTLDKHSVAGYGLLMDIYDDPALILRVDQTRDIYLQGQETIGYVILTLVVLFMWSGTASVLLLDRFLLSRLSRLSADVEKLGASGNSTDRIPDGGEDEFARLAQSINGTLSSLERAQRELRASETRNRALVAALPDLVIRVDKNGIPLDKGPTKGNGVSATGQEFASRWPGETLEERLAFSAEMLQHAGLHVKRALETGGTSTFEFLAAMNGHTCRYEARVAASGEDEALIVVRDISGGRDG